MSNSIITSLFWVRKNWARSIPLEYETINNIEENPKIKKISKVTKKLKEEGKLKGNETIKESTRIISENMEIEKEENDENIQMPIFCEDLKNYYTKEEIENKHKERDLKLKTAINYSSVNENEEVMMYEHKGITCSRCKNKIIGIRYMWKLY